MSKSRSWCFTINNYTDAEYKAILDIEYRYVCVGKEVGESGTPHLQGYIELPGPVRLSAVKALVGDRAHLEQRRGTPEEASKYCKKDGDFFEDGILPKQGRRTDLESVATAILSKSFKPEDFPIQYIKYQRGIDALSVSLYTDRSEPPTVHWRYGKAGVGKTRFVFDTHGYDNVYVKDGTIWWNGYTQQSVILIDDFSGKWDFRDFLRLLDRYPYQGQYKGGYVKINSPFIYITCEWHPSFIYRGANELAQITRRLTSIEEIGVPPIPAPGITNGTHK